MAVSLVYGVKMNYPNDSLKCIQNAWYKQLVNFRAWYMPETQLTADWKLRAIGNAIKACPSRMMDDSEAMLSEYRKSQKHDEVSKVLLPVMLTATALTDQPLMLINYCQYQILLKRSLMRSG